MDTFCFFFCYLKLSSIYAHTQSTDLSTIILWRLLRYLLKIHLYIARKGVCHRCDFVYTVCHYFFCMKNIERAQPIGISSIKKNAV